MMSRLILWLALRVVGIAAVLVPRAARTDWKREWEAELRYGDTQLRRKPARTWRMSMEPLRRALGSLPDAAWIRRQFTLDADAAHDAAHAVRMLLKAPGFTAITLLVFAIGIGAATAMVSVADALFMRPLPFPDAARIVTVWQVNRATGVGREEVAPGNALDWMKRARSFDAVALAEPRSVDATFEGREPEQLGGARVSEQFFTVFAVPMLQGRPFLPAEFQQGGPRAVILSHDLWDRIGADPRIIGKPLRLGGDTYTVVGVLPADFELRPFDNRFPQPEPLLWLPRQGVQNFEPNLRGRGYWNVFGRLAPGVPVDQAAAEFAALSAQLAREHPNTNTNVVAEVEPLRTHLAGGLHAVLPFLLGAAAILLTVACANVANLLLAHGVGRTREFAVRQALGASRTRLVRQMLMESLLLAAAGGALGLALARWILDTIASLRPLDAARVDQIPIDARGALIACGVTLAAAIAAGLAPALQLTRPAAVAALKEGRRSSARQRARGALVVFEVAAAVVLAVGAGLLVRSFLIVQRVDPGFSPRDVVALQIFLSDRHDTQQKKVVFFRQALERIRTLPGVISAGAVSTLPFGLANMNIRLPLAIAGRPARPGDEGLVYTTVAAGDYFQAMGIPLIKGRLFDSTDTSSSRQVVLVSRSAAQALWPDSDPIGSKVRTRFTGIDYDAEVVGIVGEVRHQTLERPARAEVFIPHAQASFSMMTLVVRTAPGSPTSIQALKEQVWALDPRQPFYASSTLEQLISRSLMGRRFNLFLLGSFALATLLLATAGVYGVMSFSTSQRTGEFGVRIALGARRRDIVGLVVGEGVKLAGLGVILGIIVAVPVTSLLQTLLFGVTATDFVTFLTVGLVLVSVAAAACYVPTRRALGVDPLEALRID
jgi:putative ABC transport system permease protein